MQKCVWAYMWMLAHSSGVLEAASPSQLPITHTSAAVLKVSGSSSLLLWCCQQEPGGSTQHPRFPQLWESCVCARNMSSPRIPCAVLPGAAVPQQFLSWKTMFIQASLEVPYQIRNGKKKKKALCNQKGFFTRSWSSTFVRGSKKKCNAWIITKQKMVSALQTLSPAACSACSSPCFPQQSIRLVVCMNITCHVQPDLPFCLSAPPMWQNISTICFCNRNKLPKTHLALMETDSFLHFFCFLHQSQ